MLHLLSLFQENTVERITYLLSVLSASNSLALHNELDPMIADILVH